jgi:hypothetical protein
MMMWFFNDGYILHNNFQLVSELEPIISGSENYGGAVYVGPNFRFGVANPHKADTKVKFDYRIIDQKTFSFSSRTQEILVEPSFRGEYYVYTPIFDFDFLETSYGLFEGIYFIRVYYIFHDNNFGNVYGGQENYIWFKTLGDE